MNVSEDINFSKLEKVFQSAKDAEETYTRENDAKFRAVHQKVESYEQFRDIVAASHLNPLERKDISISEKRNQPWNTFYSSNKSSSDTLEDISEMKLDMACINSLDKLTKQWKLLKTSEERCNFLFQLPCSSLERILSIDIPTDFMKEVTQTLTSTFDSDHASDIVDILSAFTKSKRFQLSLQFLSKVDKVHVKDLFLLLEKEGIDVSDLMHCYKLS